MLEWNVWVLNFNGRKIELHNVFNHHGFLKDCQEAAKKFANDQAGFTEEVRRNLMYWYWCKCEWEVIIGPWPTSDRFQEIKVDVYSQIMANENVFFPWLWDHRSELKKMP